MLSMWQTSELNGADICGAGTDVIKTMAAAIWAGTTHSIIPDQSRRVTYMVAAAATGGDVLIRNVIPALWNPFR